jgi:hypothetical protein
MNAGHRFHRWARRVVAAAGVVALAASAQAGEAVDPKHVVQRGSKAWPGDRAAPSRSRYGSQRSSRSDLDATLTSLVGKQLKPGWRVVEVQPPIGYQTIPPGPGFMEEELEAIPQDLPIVVVQIMDDASIAVGRVANALATAIVFQQDTDTGFFRPMKSADDAGIAGLPPHYVANQMFFGNGFAPGDVISGYDLLVFNSPRSSGTAQLEVELWTGDPLGSQDTVCGDPPTPIAGTHATFSNLPQAAELCPGGTGKDRADECLGMFQLRADFGAGKVTIDCDHVWMVIWLTEGCRLGWRWAGLTTVGGHAASIGSSDFIQQIRACSQGRFCNTPSGYVGPGVCCDSGEACDHSDADPANWLPCFNKGEINATFCFDNAAGHGISNLPFFEPAGYYASFVANIYAPTDFTVSLKPVMPPASTKHAATATYTLFSRDNKITEAILRKGGEPIWMEFRWSDFDPGGTGIEIRAWEVDLDSSGYRNGLGGDLGVFRVACTDNTPCVDQLGPASTCNWPPQLGVCTPGFIDVTRTDYIFNAAVVDLNAVAFSTPDFRYISTLLEPRQLPSTGMETYAGTLVLEVPDTAKGTYTIGIYPPPATGMIDSNGQFLPLLGLIPALIRIADCNGNGIPDGQDIADGTSDDCNNNVIPDECEDTTADCNGNGVWDACDIADGTSIDCNQNGIPDECEERGNADCNGNGETDFCDIAAGTSRDCNENSIPDECDLAEGSSQDCNGNEIPDECDFPRPTAAADVIWVGPESCSSDWECPNESVCRDGICYFTYNRFLRFHAGNSSLPAAIRIRHVASGATQFVALPFTKRDILRVPSRILTFSRTTDVRVYLFWPSEAINVGDCFIIPGEEYEIQILGVECDPEDENSYSQALTLPTARFADAVGYPAATPPNDVVNILEATFALDAFRGLGQTTSLLHYDIEPEVPDLTINITDAVEFLRGFHHYARYRFTDPQDCP